MDKGKLSFTIGLPRSGKTTFCNQWVEEGKKRVIVCADDFRMALYGQRYIGRAEQFVWATVDLATKALLARGFHVMMDETSCSELTLQRMFKIDNAAEYFIIDTPIEVCKERAVLTKQEDLIPVIDRINRNFRRIVEDAGFLERMREKCHQLT